MAKNWTNIQKKYKGQWVAFAKDEETVIASGETLREAMAHAHTKGHADPIMARMPEKIVTYVGTV